MKIFKFKFSYYRLPVGKYIFLKILKRRFIKVITIILKALNYFKLLGMRGL